MPTAPTAPRQPADEGQLISDALYALSLEQWARWCREVREKPYEPLLEAAFNVSDKLADRDVLPSSFRYGSFLPSSC